jgi:hypothetical protein
VHKANKQTSFGLVAPTEPTAGFVSLAVLRASAGWHGTRRWRRRRRCEGKRAGRSEQASKQQRVGNGVSERVRCLLHLTRSFWLSTLWSVVSRSADHAPPTAAALASTARESPTEATRSASAQTTARPIESDRIGSDRIGHRHAADKKTDSRPGGTQRTACHVTWQTTHSHTRAHTARTPAHTHRMDLDGSSCLCRAPAL